MIDPIFKEFDTVCSGSRQYLYSFPTTDCSRLKWLCMDYICHFDNKWIDVSKDYPFIHSLLCTEEYDNILMAAYMIKELKNEY